MIRTFRAELVKLLRRRTILVTAVITLVAAVGGSAVVLAAVKPSGRTGGGRGPTLADMTAAGGGTEGDKIREGFYKVGEYKGLIKTYKQPFTPTNHDALTENDYIMVKYQGEQIVPVK